MMQNSIFKVSKCFNIFYTIFTQVLDKIEILSFQEMLNAYCQPLFKCCKIFNYFFLLIYLGEGRGRGGARMHVYLWEYIVSLYYRTA